MTIDPIALPVPSFAGSFDDPEETGPPKSMLFFGDTDTRKTSMIGALYKAGFFKKILVFNLDNGVEVLYNDPIVKAGIQAKHIDIKTISEFSPTARQELEAAILEVAGKWRAPDGTILDNPNVPDYGYDLVVIDTLGILSSIGLGEFKRTTYNDAGNKLDGLGAYGRLKPCNREMVKIIHDSKRFTGLFLSHVKETDAKAGPVKLVANVDGGFTTSLPSIPSIVGYLNWTKHPESDEISLTATLRNSDFTIVKCRYHQIPDTIYDFDVATMYGDIYKGLNIPLPQPVEAKTIAAPAA